MGVVHREGGWRLEKEDDGVYSITHEGRVETKVITSDYRSNGLIDGPAGIGVPVREVDSFSEAKAIFDEMATSRSGHARTMPTSTVSETDGLPDVDDDVLPDLPPGGFLLISLLIGGYLVVRSGFGLGSNMGLIGIGFLASGVLLAGYAYYLSATEGKDDALAWLISVEKDGDRQSPQSDGGQASIRRTPPAPQQLKNELHIERADQQCEWCETPVDSPDVHHIEPRSEGGPNTPENLIVLCPNCHRNADRGAIARSKLRHKVHSQMKTWNR